MEYERDIKKRLSKLEFSKNALAFGLITKLSQDINLISRYEETSSFVPPIFNLNVPILSFGFVINSNLIKELNLKTNFLVENSILKLETFEAELNKNFIYFSLFKNKKELPSLNDFLGIFNSEEFLLENGLISNFNIYNSEMISSNLDILAEINDTPIDPKNYLYFAKLKNDVNIVNKNGFTNPFLNFYYVEKGTNDIDDKKFKGFIVLETGVSIFNDVFKMFDFNVEYSKLIGNDITDSLVNSEFMKSIPIFKMENRDALYLYSKFQLQALKPFKISLGLFESGELFNTKILGDRYQSPISKKLINEKRLIFRESDIIEYTTNGAGIFGCLSLGEDYDYSLSLTYSYFEEQNYSINKLGFNSLLRFMPFNLYSELSLYNIKEPLIKVEEFFTISDLFDLETKILFTKDLSSQSKEDYNFTLGLSGDLNLPVDIHNLLLGITYLNQGILIDKEKDVNGKNTFSAIIGYENYDISNWINKDYFSDISLNTSLSYLHTLNKNILKSLYEFQFSLSSYISDFFADRLSFKPAIAISNRESKWIPGLNIELNYLINNNCILAGSLGNMFETEKNYFVDSKIKTNLQLNRLNYDFNDWAIKLEFELKI